MWSDQITGMKGLEWRGGQAVRRCGSRRKRQQRQWYACLTRIGHDARANAPQTATTGTYPVHTQPKHPEPPRSRLFLP